MWHLLQKNSDQLTVLAVWVTGLATIAAGWIAWKYVKVTRTLAEGSAQQTAATQTQTEITLQMIRPYVEVQLPQQVNFFRSPEFYRLSFSLIDHGQVPAFLTQWHLTIRGDGFEPVHERSALGWRRCLFPAGSEPVTCTRGEGVPPDARARPVVEVIFVVTYRMSRARHAQSLFTFRQNGLYWEPVDHHVT